jgi:hypothetical protein
MTSELARALFLIVWGTGVVLWALALRRSLLYLSPIEIRDWPGAGGAAPGREAFEPDVRRGVVEVEARAEALLEEVATRLGADLGGTFVLREERDTLVLTNSLPPAFSQFGWANVSRALVRVTATARARSLATYELDARPLRRRLGRVALVVALAAGLPTVVGVGVLIWWFVLPSQAPAVRWQVLQTFQIAHALWPPFLVLSRLGANLHAAATSLEAVIRAAGEAVGG